jgi:hypothetical protein
MAKRGSSRRRELGKVRGVDDAAAAVKQLVCDEHTEGQMVIGLDDTMHVCGAVFNCPCDRCHDEILEGAAELVDLAAAMEAEELVLVTFVEPDRLSPTAADVARFEGLRLECADEDVWLLDHLLFSGHQWRSVAELSAGRGASTSW